MKINAENRKRRIQKEGRDGFCILCERLKDKYVQSQVYHDMYGWLTSLTCAQVTVSIDILLNHSLRNALNEPVGLEHLCVSKYYIVNC